MRWSSALFYGIGSCPLRFCAYQFNLPFLEGISSGGQSAPGNGRLMPWAGGIQHRRACILTLLISGSVLVPRLQRSMAHAIRLDQRMARHLAAGFGTSGDDGPLLRGRDPLDATSGRSYLLMSLALVVRSNLDTSETGNGQSEVFACPPAVRDANFRGNRHCALAGWSWQFAWGVPSAWTCKNAIGVVSKSSWHFRSRFKQMSEVWSRLFAPIQGDGPATVPTTMAPIC